MREEYGQATAHFDLKRAGSYAVSYENPNFPQKSMEPYNRMSTASYLPTNFASLDIIDLECSGRILSQKAALEGFGGTLFFEMRWEDLDKRGERMREVDISRATDNEDGLLKIVAQLGYSMGMDNEGLQKIVACVKAKVSTNTRP
jgi:hypothetical protein